MSIGVAVIGVGHWGPNLARNLHNEIGVGLRWVVDRDPDRLDYVRQSLPGVRTSTTVDDEWSDPEVEAVAIATPTSTHGKLIEQALRSGKHVLVEKPIVDDSIFGTSLVDLAAEAGLVLMVGHVFLFNEAILVAKRFVDEGELGDVFHDGPDEPWADPLRRQRQLGPGGARCLDRQLSPRERAAERVSGRRQLD